ncbi:MAG TPA: ornithine cyclodeaminase family protein [Actinomycetota bacterium]|nr:ornithine cyclodeaminase family protein [Actinomycetota bacterium]
MLVLSRADVASLLDPDELIDALSVAMIDLSSGAASMPTRVAAFVPGVAGLLGAMPAWLPSAAVLETKLVSVFPRNAGGVIPTHQAVIVVFDPGTGEPISLMDGTEITAQRTAAGSALATAVLAREDARVMAVVGTGVQARAHLRYVARVRGFDRVAVAGRDPLRAGAVAEQASADSDVNVSAAESIEAAVRAADVVCATTGATTPVLARDWLADGTHVNSVGWTPDGREIDAETVRDSVVVVESRSSALSEGAGGANDLVWPIRDGVVGPDHVHAEIGEILAGTRPGRTSADQITLYKSVGVAVQDAAAAGLVLRAAHDRGVGREVDV